MCVQQTGQVLEGFPGGSSAGSHGPGCFLLQLRRSRNAHREGQPGCPGTLVDSSGVWGTFQAIRRSAHVCCSCPSSVTQTGREDVVDSVLRSVTHRRRARCYHYCCCVPQEGESKESRPMAIVFVLWFPTCLVLQRDRHLPSRNNTYRLEHLGRARHSGRCLVRVISFSPHDNPTE